MGNLVLEQLNLFNGVLLEENNGSFNKRANLEDLKEDLKIFLENGVFVDPRLLNNSNWTEIKEEIHKKYVTSSRSLNSTFHKSFQTIKESSQEKLWAQAMIHYMTTYGFEDLGIYDENSIFIPSEKLDLPTNEKGVTYVAIKSLSMSEITDQWNALANSGIALSEDTIKSMGLIASKIIGISSERYNNIENHELKIYLTDYIECLPTDPVEFLRYLIYRGTGKTLIIKSEEVIDAIKNSDIDYGKEIDKFFDFDLLSTVFYRFKPLWLAMKSSAKIQINSLRRKAKKHHVPMKKNKLDNVVNKMSNGKSFSKGQVNVLFKNCNVWRKIRILYSLSYLSKNPKSSLYRIRNGKSYVKTNDVHREISPISISNVFSSIANSVRHNFAGKTFILPDDFVYSLPTSEKQFIGNIPAGSYVETNSPIIAGIQWYDKNNVARTDLDLSLLDKKMGKIGWNSYYSDETKNVIYSGDMTSAPGTTGAAEYFWIDKVKQDFYIVNVNDYTCHYGVNYSIVVARAEDKSRIEEDYAVRTAELLLKVDVEQRQNQQVIGFVETGETNKFILANFSNGNNAVSVNGPGGPALTHAYLKNFYSNVYKLEDLIYEADGIVMHAKDIEEESDDSVTFIKSNYYGEYSAKKQDIVDLRLDKINKSTIINLFTK